MSTENRQDNISCASEHVVEGPNPPHNSSSACLVSSCSVLHTKVAVSEPPLQHNEGTHCKNGTRTVYIEIKNKYKLFVNKENVPVNKEPTCPKDHGLVKMDALPKYHNSPSTDRCLPQTWQPTDDEARFPLLRASRGVNTSFDPGSKNESLRMGQRPVGSLLPLSS